MASNTEGFLEPKIDKNHCTGCRQCQEKCPVLQPLSLQNLSPDVYACWSLDDEIRMQSSSGGLFSVIANEILERGGVVFGALFDETLKVRHDFAESEEKLSRFRTSKYVQSEIGDSYQKVKFFLGQNRVVLFTGTPCQIAGLYSYLGNLRDHPNLTTCDLICHGVPSPKVFDSYLQWLKKKLKISITDLRMRDKSHAWRPSHSIRIILSDATDLLILSHKDPFLFGFAKDMFTRPSCHICCFAKEYRYGDFTLADFWDIGKTVPFAYDTKRGVSLLLVNSDKGHVFFDTIKHHIFYEKRTMEEARQGNPMLYRPSYPHPKRERFFRDYHQYPFELVVKKYLRPKLNVTGKIKKLLKVVLGDKVVSTVKKFVK